MKTTEIKCDECDKDLTFTSNAQDYFLSLNVETKRHRGSGAYKMLMTYPALERDHHFCNLKCLKSWAEKK